MNGIVASLIANNARVEATLAYKPPYEWDALSRFLQARAAQGVELADSRRYARTFEIGGACGHFEAIPSLDQDWFDVTIHVGSAAAIPSVIARLQRLLDLDADPAIISAHLGNDPALKHLVAARPGLRVPGAWDGFELAVRAILGQQVTVSAATQLAGRLIAAFGRRYDGSPRLEGLTHLFPTAERLRDADVASIGMPRARGAAINALAAAALNDPTLFDAGQDPATAVARLRGIRGIGEWTAQYIAMRALRIGDAFPSGDVGLQRALANGGPRPRVQELEARAEAWRPWRAYAAIHLWTGESQ